MVGVWQAVRVTLKGKCDRSNNAANFNDKQLSSGKSNDSDNGKHVINASITKSLKKEIYKC
jgi:hypothetical protein